MELELWAILLITGVIVCVVVVFFAVGRSHEDVENPDQQSNPDRSITTVGTEREVGHTNRLMVTTDEGQRPTRYEDIENQARQSDFTVDTETESSQTNRLPVTTINVINEIERQRQQEMQEQLQLWRQVQAQRQQQQNLLQWKQKQLQQQSQQIQQHQQTPLRGNQTRLQQPSQQTQQKQDLLQWNQKQKQSQQTQQQRTQLQRLLQGGNQQAATERKQLDLHYFRLKDAMEVFKLFLAVCEADYKEGGFHRKDRFINVITGRGKHSPNGVPIIKPAVANYLGIHDYDYGWSNPGMARIDLMSKMDEIA